MNIKPGEIEHDHAGVVKEDPTAVKELPIWTDEAGVELAVVGKRVNTIKSQVRKSGDPFYEYKIMQLVNEIGLPAPKPIAKAEQSGSHLIVMEKALGFTYFDGGPLLMHYGYLPGEIETLKRQAGEQMAELKDRFDEAGIIRKWKLSDIIFDVDIEAKKIRKITPVDWERTKIDETKLRAYKKRLKASSG
ncbi:MAG: hypothetical protein EXS49_02315 [Candidatus Pacebacteria bacterium]|nr:hypothetical protein [Candidatus Paceibacterota bacterium]